MKKSIKKYIPFAFLLIIGIFIGFTWSLYLKGINQKKHSISQNVRIFFSDKNSLKKGLENDEKKNITLVKAKSDLCFNNLNEKEKLILKDLKKEELSILSANVAQDYKVILLRIEGKDKVFTIKKFKKCLKDEVNKLNINLQLKEGLKKMKIEEVIELFYGVNISLKS